MKIFFTIFMMCCLLSDAIATQITKTKPLSYFPLGISQPKKTEVISVSPLILEDYKSSLQLAEELLLDRYIYDFEKDTFNRVIKNYTFFGPDKIAILLAKIAHNAVLKNQKCTHNLMQLALRQTKDCDNNELVQFILTNYKNDDIFLSKLVYSLTDPQQIEICTAQLDFVFIAKNISNLDAFKILLANYQSSNPEEIVTLILTTEGNRDLFVEYFSDNLAYEQIVTKYKNCDDILLAVAQKTSSRHMLNAIIKIGGTIPNTLEYIAKHANSEHHVAIIEHCSTNLAAYNFIAQNTNNYSAVKILAKRVDILAERLNITGTELLLKIFSNAEVRMYNHEPLRNLLTNNKDRDLLALAKDPGISTQVLRNIIEYDDSDAVYLAIAGHHSNDVDLLTKMARLTASENVQIELLQPKYNIGNAALQSIAGKTENIKILRLILTHPNVNNSVLESLNYDCLNKTDLAAIINHQCVSSAVFEKLMLMKNLDDDLLRLIITKLRGLARAMNGRHEALFIQANMGVQATSDGVIKLIQKEFGENLMQLKDRCVYIYDTKAKNPYKSSRARTLLYVLLHNGQIYNNYIGHQDTYLTPVKNIMEERIETNQFLHATLTPDNLRSLSWRFNSSERIVAEDDPTPDRIIKAITMAVSRLSKQDKTINETISGSEVITLESDIGTYTGTVSQGKPHGLGKMIYKNGDSYNGEWKHGLEHGKGKAVYQNGDSYEGKWYFGFEDGFGEYIEKSPTGKRYKGSFTYGEFINRRITIALGEPKEQNNTKPKWHCTCIGHPIKHNAEDGLIAAHIITFLVQADDETSANEQCQEKCEKCNMKMTSIVFPENEHIPQ